VTVLFRRGGSNESGESRVSDIADPKTKQETIPEGFEFIALRHLVARTEERNQRDLHLLVAVVEDPLVGDFQQCIQDRAACFENFVEEDEFALAHW
jgi:hypothetical protein